MYPDEQEIKHMAEYVAKWTFRHIIHISEIDRLPAAQIATAAADRYAQALTLAISEYYSQAESPLPTTARVESVRTILRDDPTSRDPNARPIRERSKFFPSSAKLIAKAPQPPIRCCLQTFETVEEWEAHASPLCRPVHVPRSQHNG